MQEAIANLESQVEALLSLTLSAFERFCFLQPMLDNRQLLDRIEQEKKGAGFNRLRAWLYWSLVLELAKLCHDNGKQKRAPSIYAIREKLSNPALLQALEDKYAKNNRELADADTLRAEFRTLYARFSESADRMLSERVAGGYKTIRDKLIAHNELRKDGQFHDVKTEGLKYGDEHALLKTLKELVTDLMLIVRNTDIQSVWSSSPVYDRQMVSDFWELDRAGNAT
jgi:AbiU2